MKTGQDYLDLPVPRKADDNNPFLESLFGLGRPERKISRPRYGRTSPRVSLTRIDCFYG
jgi:hypothetical protein